MLGGRPYLRDGLKITKVPPNVDCVPIKDCDGSVLISNPVKVSRG